MLNTRFPLRLAHIEKRIKITPHICLAPPSPHTVEINPKKSRLRNTHYPQPTNHKNDSYYNLTSHGNSCPPLHTRWGSLCSLQLSGKDRVRNCIWSRDIKEKAANSLTFSPAAFGDGDTSLLGLDIVIWGLNALVCRRVGHIFKLYRPGVIEDVEQAILQSLF